MASDKQKVVQVPGLGNVSFPGTMSDDQISSALQSHLSSSDHLTDNPNGEGLYQMFGKAPTSSDPNAVGQIAVPFSKVEKALQSGYTWYGNSGDVYSKDKAAAGKAPSFWGTLNEKIQGALQPQPGQTPFNMSNPMSNTDRAFFSVLYSTPGYLKDLAKAWWTGSQDQNREMMDLIDPSTMAGSMYTRFKDDWKKDPNMAIDNLKGTLLGLATAGKATHAVEAKVGSFIAPHEVPTRADTRVVHANPVGEVRMGADNVPTVWMHPEAFNEFMRVRHPDEQKINGLLGENVALDDLFNHHATSEGLSNHPAWEHVQDLLQKAQAAAPDGSATVQRRVGRMDRAVRVLREEKIHAWQRSLSQNGQVDDYLAPEKFTGLASQIPAATRKSLSEYEKAGATDPIWVNEVAARYMANDLHGATPEEASSWLSQYFQSVIDQHGPDALSNLERTRGIGSKIKEEIENGYRSANAGAAEGSVSGVPERGAAGAPRADETAPAGGPEAIPAPAYSAEPAEEVKPPITALFSRLREEIAGRDPDEWIKRGAEEFAAPLGRNIQTGANLRTDLRSKEIADAYEALQHNPNDPAVAAAYQAMKQDIADQWKHATQRMGVTFEPSKTNPYPNSAEMRDDVIRNRRLRFYQGGEMPSDHPLAEVNPETGFSYNDMLRAVHDLFGHAMEGNQFGPVGEERAWNSHAQMFSSEALPALTTETKGQNSWVNFGPQMRDAQGNILQPGQPGYLSPQERAFAPQKAGILPERFHYRNDTPVSFLSPNTVNLTLPEAMQRLTSRIQIRFTGAARDLAKSLGLRPSVRPVLGSWEGGGENSTIHQFPAGTDPDLVRYYNAILGKLGHQNATGAFYPGEGPDSMYTFWTDTADSKAVAKTLLDHGLQNSTIEPAEGGNVVYLIGNGNEFSGQVRNVADALGVKGHVEQYTGTAEFPGNYESRDAAARDFSSAAEALESRHPEWRPIREGFESRPDVNSLRRLIESTNEVAPEPQIDIVHYSNAPDIESLDPAYYGQNKTHDVTGSVVNRPDLRRKESFPGYWNNETYVGEASSPEFRNAAGERFSARQYTYKGKVPALGIYDLHADPDNILELSRKELADRNFKKFGVRLQPSDAEVQAYAVKRLKDLGYSGRRDINGMIASWERIPVEKADIPPAQDIAQGRTPSGSAVFSRTWEDISNYLTKEELARHNTPEKKQKLVDAVNAMPDAAEWDAAVKAGFSNRLWYERGSKAFDALLKSMPDMFARQDKNKFLNFVAALSPVQPVRQNLLMAINLWDKWNRAGRPMDVEWTQPKKFKGVKNKNASLYRIMQGRGNTYGVDLPARLLNAIRALQGEPLSGPKVSAFAPNLGTDVERSTNDTWMAVLAGVDPNQINQPHLYDGVSAMVRQAAEENGIPTRQAQAAAWSFIKSLAELSGWGKDTWRPPQDILEQGYFTPELVNRHAADFADLLQNDPEIRERIEEIGGDLNVLDKNLGKLVPERPTANKVTTPELLTQLLRAARRLEAARSESKVAEHLQRKSDQASLFDTSFNPESAAFSRATPSDDLAELRDNYQNKINEYAQRGLNESGNLNLSEDERVDLSKTFRAMVNKFNQEYPDARGQDLINFVHRLQDFATPSAFSRENPVSDERNKAFEAIADQQRYHHEGDAEDAMLAVQHHPIGAGVWSDALEHVGDLLHRMTERTGIQALNYGESGFGYGNVKDKVDKKLWQLKRDHTYIPFAQEHEQNMQGNYEYRKERGQIPEGKSLEDLKSDLYELGEKYSQEHEKLPVYNRMQWLARQAAVDLGRRDFKSAQWMLEQLKEHLDQGPEHWQQEAGKYDPNYMARGSAFSRKSENEPDYRELKVLDPKMTMGQPNSAALITGDGKVEVGKFHDAMAKKLGYGTGQGHAWMQPFYDDGGVRIRAHVGEVYVTFGKDDPQTIARVQNAIKNLRGNDFVVNYSGEPDKVRSWAGTKDEALLGLDNFAAGKSAPEAPYGTARYFLKNYGQPAFSRSSSGEGDFDKLRYVDPKSSLGLKNSAALVGPDGRVVIGDWHEKLAEELGYKNNEFYKEDLLDDGGVRIRAQRGRMLVEFGKNDPATIERVRNTINSLRGSIFILDYSGPEKQYWKGTKEQMLQHLDDLENGRNKPQAPYGTSQYFRQNLPDVAFSREQEETPEFKNWFGDWQDPHAWSSRKDPNKPDVSMAVDPKDHRPLILYHATPNDFNEFKTGVPSKNYGTFGSWDVTRSAIFLTPDHSFAERYIEDVGGNKNRRGDYGYKKGSRVMPVYANIKHPLDLRDSASGTVDGEFLDELQQHGVNPRWFMNGDKSWELFDDEGGEKNGTNFVRAMKEMGYDGAIITEENDSGEPSDVWVAFNPEQVKSAIGNRGTFDPSNKDIAFHISPEQALDTNVPVEMPKDEKFAEAVNNTPGAEITPNGLMINLTRFQKPEQEAEQSVRTGVFYLPSGSSKIGSYATAGKFTHGWYGGTEKFTGETLIRRPLFVQGATGGKAPEAAYDAIEGKGATKQLHDDIHKAIFTNGDTEARRENIKKLLKEYGADPGMTDQILRNSTKGNQLVYALQENIVAHAVREKGYDAIVGYSRWGNKPPRISEVFDTRETTYPSKVIPSHVHPKYSLEELRAEAERRNPELAKK